MLKPFEMATEVDEHKISFYLSDNGKAWIRVVTPTDQVLSTMTYNRKKCATLAADLVNPNLWPAFAQFLAPNPVQDAIF